MRHSNTYRTISATGVKAFFHPFLRKQWNMPRCELLLTYSIFPYMNFLGLEQAKFKDRMESGVGLTFLVLILKPGPSVQDCDHVTNVIS